MGVFKGSGVKKFVQRDLIYRKTGMCLEVHQEGQIFPLLEHPSSARRLQKGIHFSVDIST